MKTLKNLKTTTLALIFGLGLVLSQSAFTAASTTQTWVKDSTTGEWHVLGSIPGYCSGEEDICEGDFENGVNPNLPIDPLNPTEFPDPIETRPGTFIRL